MRKAVELYIELKVLIKKEKYFKSVNSQSEIEKSLAEYGKIFYIKKKKKDQLERERDSVPV